MSQVRKQVLTRSSLACLSCRSRHQKCDAKKPRCTRCTDADRPCQYTRSRRGGNKDDLSPRRPQDIQPQPRTPNQLDDYISALITPPAMEGMPPANVLPQTSPMPAASRSAYSPHSDHREESRPRRRSVNYQCGSGKDPLIEAYYQTFHKYHPVVLPRRHLLSLLNDAGWKPRLEPLVAVLRLIGNLHLSQEWSASLQGEAESKMEGLAKTDPIRVQCHLLYSAALFWQDHKAKSQREMGKAVELALALKMFEREFAWTHSDIDATLAECWRRTWWMVYLFDAFYAGTLGNTGFSVVCVNTTVDLPCDEAQYESGHIPEPKTLPEWDCREFDEEEKPFSSFACLIGAVRCATLAKDASLKTDARKSPDDMLHVADSILDSWMLLLPKSKKQVMLRNGDIDELLFQAHHLIHVVIIGFHRPLSDLKFNAVEDVSSCARDPAPDGPTPEHINVHTVRVLRSVESQIRLLALPSRPFNHTPFCTCMISEGTLALLSACKFLLRGNELAIARDQIRLTIGCLKHLGDLWPRTARNVSQIQTIAKHVLGIEGNGTAKGGTSGSAHSGTSVEDGGSSGEVTSSSNSDVFSAIRDFDDICGCAASQGRVAIIELLVKELAVPVDSRIRDGLTALQPAFRNKDAATTPPVSASSGPARCSTDKRMLRALLDGGADPNEISINDYKKTALHVACEGGYKDVWLPPDRKGKREPLLHNGWTLLHEACFFGKAPLVEQLLDRGSKLEARRPRHGTPLHVAVKMKKVERVRLLVGVAQLGSRLRCGFSVVMGCHEAPTGTHGPFADSDAGERPFLEICQEDHELTLGVQESLQ
ncbi:C6 zinc finger domain protein [Cordyceps fumosorosea ARSEF 2679]|uniref:C6 zinc finger domain protein n=1 Tax=Cordyceps fumosorosea (strain ARSEF 2679) TaxID=1081104 RepID=A0A168BQF5_CORFA|nr:C6 zinc finger domain protein [Cordyceps fumosorosea ARSEF 2679]OAA70418.1 C6 zinc finger domain protein [Cordyceps fumosorosea ARSEF 2679]